MKKWLLAAALCLVALHPVGASTFLALSTGDLVLQSTAIVRGEVLQVESFWEPTGRIIVTEAMVRVERALVGDTPTVVRVKTFGGTVSGYTVEAIGFPTFTRGERLVLFLEADREADVMRVTGYQQGQYRIEPGVGGGELAVSAVDAGAELVAVDGRVPDRPQALPLADLEALILTEAAAAGRAVR